MPEELFYEEFNGKLDTTKWEEVGGLRGVRSKSRFGSGRIELANSVATLYGGGNRHDYAIKTVKTFSPSDGELSAEVNMLIQRPNPKNDDILFGFKVSDIQKYVPYVVVGSRESTGLRAMAELLITKQRSYFSDYRIRTNNVVAETLERERVALSQTQYSNSFDIAKNEWQRNLRFDVSKDSQSVYINSKIVAKLEVPIANVDYSFLLYVLNNSTLKVDNILISRK